MKSARDIHFVKVPVVGVNPIGSRSDSDGDEPCSPDGGSGRSGGVLSSSDDGSSGVISPLLALFFQYSFCWGSR